MDRVALVSAVLLFAVACASSPEADEPEGSDVSVWSDPVRVEDVRHDDPVPIRDNPPPEPPAEDSDEEKQKDGEWLVAPLPFVNPTLGGGLGFFTGYIFPLDPEDRISPPSTIGLGGFYASNGSWGAFGGMKGYFADDTWRFRVGLFHASLNVDFYGIGHDAGEAGRSIRLNQKVTGGIAEVTPLVGWDSYFGPRIRATWVETEVREDDPLVALIPDDWLSQQVISLGAKFQRDTRDHVRYPTEGTLFELTLDSHKKAWGSDEEYDTWESAFNVYREVADETVLAGRLFGRFTFGDVPYYALSQMGKKSDLRGYNAGQYRDRMLLAGQVEGRHFFADDFGAVVFAGAGEVSAEMTHWEGDEILPSLGAGLRYTIAPENKVNFRFDVAWGAEGWTFYFGVGEAF
ncbi:MAG: BamA/TamA family outer membrane protein [Planctomycetota bacterium]